MPDTTPSFGSGATALQSAVGWVLVMAITLLACGVARGQSLPATTPPAADAADPMNSAACQGARQRLDAALGAAVANRDANAAALDTARKQAQQICLGRETRSTRGLRPPQPVTAVPPTTAPVGPSATVPPARPSPVPRQAIAPPPAVVAPAPPPVAIPRPTVITGCDPGGCWDSNGTRLPRTGPNLMGPSGLCSVQGNFAYCP